MISKFASIKSGHENFFESFRFKPHKSLSDQEIKSEIEIRLNLFGLSKEQIEKTKKGTIYLNEKGVLNRIIDQAELDFIHSIEKKYDVKIYYVFKETYERFQDCGYRYFFIANDKENWQFDRVDIQIHKPLCFKYGMLYDKRQEYAEPIRIVDDPDTLFKDGNHETNQII